MRAVPPPHISITGLGYLGLPLAQKFYRHGSRVAAIKRSLTSDDINLPIHLDTFDLNRTDTFQTALWRHHADKPVWFFLLPPSFLAHYADTVKQWAELARACNVQHLIFTSSTSVYGDKARECNETAAPDPQTESARQILAAEQHLLDNGVPNIDILRLGGLYAIPSAASCKSKTSKAATGLSISSTATSPSKTCFRRHPTPAAGG